MTISEAVFFWEIFLFSSDQGWLPSMNDSHPERDHLMVVIVVIPNAVPLRWDYTLPAGGRSSPSVPELLGCGLDECMLLLCPL